MICFFSSEVFGFTHHVAKSNSILFFTIQFPFNNHMDKSEHLIGFYKIVWVPSKTRDQKNAKKYLKNTNLSHFETKNV
jgi:hypothetical protein